MALDPVKNFAISRVATAPSPADSGTTLVVETGDGALFPDPSSSGEYNVVIYPNGEQPTSTNAEIVRVTARTSDTMTIDREEEGTSARTIVEGDIVMLAITAKMVDDLSTAVTGVVTETGTQTLTNKTLTSPKLNGDVALSSTATQLNDIVAAGIISMFGGSSAPTGYLLCDGAAVSRTTYAALFAAISTTWGIGDGSTTFNLPDMRGIFPKGAGTTTRAAGVDGNAGAYTATLGTYYQDQLQGHRHNFVLGGSDGAGKASGQTASEGGTAGLGKISTNSGTATSEFRVGDARTGGSGTLRVGNSTEPQSAGINYIIKT